MSKCNRQYLIKYKQEQKNYDVLKLGNITDIFNFLLTSLKWFEKLNFRFFNNATKLWQNLPVDLKSTGRIRQIVDFLEIMPFHFQK